MRQKEGLRDWLGLHEREKGNKDAKKTEEQRHSMARFAQFIEKAIGNKILLDSRLLFVRVSQSKKFVHKIGLLIIILPLSVSLMSATIKGSKQKQITVVFRYDDYSSYSSRTDLEVKLINTFQKYNLPITFGVIPYVAARNFGNPDPQDVLPLTPVKANILKDAVKAGIVEVALHGYSHQTIQRGPPYTEFSGMDYSTQYQRIDKGKNLLEKTLGIQIPTFIPPWNRYDLNTLRVLEKLGFKTISADSAGVAERSSQLKFLPFTCNLHELNDAVKSARKIPDIQPVIVVLFHAYDFLEIDRNKGQFTYGHLVDLLTWVRSQNDIRIRTIDEATNEIGDLDSHRFISNSQFYSLLEQYSPPFLKRLKSDKVYWSTPTVIGMKVELWFFLILFYFIELAISITVTFLVGCLLFPGLKVLESVAKYGGLVLLVLSSIYVFRHLSVSYKGITLLTCLLGMCIGIWRSLPTSPNK